MVKAGKLAGYGKGFAVGGGECRHQTNVFRHQRQRRQQGDGFEAIEKVRDRLRRDVQAIGDKQKINFRLFRFPGQVQHVVHVDAGIGHRIRVTPCRHVAGSSLNNGTQP